MNLLINIFPAFLFLILLFINYKKVRRIIALSNFIYALYFISTLSYFIMYLYYNNNYYYNITALALISLCNYILINPLSNFEKHKNIKLTTLDFSKFKFIVKFCIILGLYSVFFYALSLGRLFFYGAKEIRNTGIVLHDVGTLSSYISVVGFVMSPIIMFFAFYNMHKKILNYKYTILLILSSTGIIFYTLGVAGRDGLVIWIFCFVGLLCLFYPFYNYKTIKTLKLLSLLFVIFIAPVFMIITNDRSGGNSDESIFRYLGQPLYNLSQNIDIQNKIGKTNINYNTVFGLYYDIHNSIMGTTFNIHDYNQKCSLLGYQGNQFSFYLGSLYPYKTSSIFVLFFVLFIYFLYKRNLRVRYNNVISSTRLLIAFSWYMILIVGVFYFYYGSQYGNLYLLMPFIIKMYFNTSSDNKI